MKINLTDLGIGFPFVKGQDIPVHNCWHFSTDGSFAEVLFRDQTDFVNAMNRLYLLSRKYKLVILAFCLMDNHIHLILYGELEECNRFVHEFVRLTSADIALRHELRRELHSLPIHYQKITDDTYLKRAICYVHKNPTAANLPYLPYDYPWSSGALFFRKSGVWTNSVQEGSMLEPLPIRERRKLFCTREELPDDLLAHENLILPVNYIPVGIVEKVFRTPRAYTYFMGSTREEDIESRGGAISRMSLPDTEMRQHKMNLLQELFSCSSSRVLDTQQRVRLARELRRRYNSSIKQIARLVGLPARQLESLLQ